MKKLMVLVGVIVMVVYFSGCGSMFAITDAQAYAIKAYADNPERFGKAPFDATDRRYTSNSNHTSTYVREDRTEVVVEKRNFRQVPFSETPEGKNNAVGAVKNPKNKR